MTWVLSVGRTRIVMVLAIVGLSVSAVVGVLLGLAMSGTVNIQKQSAFGAFKPSLPSQVLDINGQLITEFFSDEKREIVSYNEVPKALTNALLTREDQGVLRAQRLLAPRNVAGAGRHRDFPVTFHLDGFGTLTQLGWRAKLYSDRTKLTVGRKLEELWWAFQLESKFSKQGNP